MAIEERVLERLPEDVKMKLDVLNYGSVWHEYAYYPMSVLVDVVIDELSDGGRKDVCYSGFLEVINKITGLGFVEDWSDDWDDRDKELKRLFDERL